MIDDATGNAIWGDKSAVVCEIIKLPLINVEFQTTFLLGINLPELFNDFSQINFLNSDFDRLVDIFLISILRIDDDVDDWATDIFSSVDKFFHSGYTLCDIHSSNTGKMERFQSHLCSWFGN